MKLMLEPITAIVVAVLLGWGWNEVVTDDRPICQLEVSNGEVTYHKPVHCEDLEA
jgi:hypothetical protein